MRSPIVVEDVALHCQECLNTGHNTDESIGEGCLSAEKLTEEKLSCEFLST